MEFNEIKEGGLYKTVNKLNQNEKYVITIEGFSPFLTIKHYFDVNENKICSEDKLRGKNFDYFKISL